MKVDIKKPLKDVFGVEMKDPKRGIITIGKVLLDVLLHNDVHGKNTSDEEVRMRWKTAKAIINEEDDLDDKIIGFAKKVASIVLPPMISGALIEALEEE